jgi:hypothetical protein
MYVVSETSRRPLRPTQLPIQRVLGSYPESTAMGREADNTFPISNEVYNNWRCTAIPPAFLPDMCRGNFTLLN